MSPKAQQQNRCQHVRADGKQCALPRSAIHNSLCVHHARLEDEFAERQPNSPEAVALVAEVLGSRDQLNTTTAVNDALSKLFSLRCRKLVSIRDALVLAYIGQLLLQTLHGAEFEFNRINKSRGWDQIIGKALREALGPDAPAEETVEVSAPARKRSSARRRARAKKARTPRPAPGQEKEQPKINPLAWTNEDAEAARLRFEASFKEPQRAPQGR